MAKVKKKSLTDDEKRKIERERKRRYREKLKENITKIEKIKEYDRERKRKSKEEGKIKSIKDMSEREKRIQRKKWRLATNKHRLNLKRNDIILNTPPSSPVNLEIQLRNSDNSRKVSAQKKNRKRRERDKRLIHKTQRALEKANRNAEKWRKRYKRLKEKQNLVSPSPKKIVERIIKSGPMGVRRNLLLGVSLCKQLKKNSEICSSQEVKKKLAENISGAVIKKEKLKSTLESKKIVSTYYQRKACAEKNRMRKKRTTHISHLGNVVSAFYEDPENSCETPGKRDYVTRKRVQKQKRYLLFTMKDLYKKFIEKTGIKKISYQSFVRLKPFWVVHKKLDQRDTCMCVTHANFKFKLQKLKLLKLLKTDSLCILLKKTVCDMDKKACMYGLCEECSLKIPEELLAEKNFEDFNTFFYKWVSKHEERLSKKSDGKPVKTKFTIKEKVLCSASELISETERDLKRMAIHTYHMRHQHKTFNAIKTSMNEYEALIVCDWSENYLCKYNEEVQAIHFGASRNQISLHTGIVYIGMQPEISSNKKKPFCTVSDNNAHDAVAIWAHLVPILSMINNECPQVKVLHFFSDGPTSQYRNKTNFFLMCKICSNYDFEISSWNFWEPGHGKGPADGIGGLVKRTCDRAVAMGHDVTSAAEFIKTVSNLNINIFKVEDYEISLMSFHVSELEGRLMPIKGTLILKCVLWNKINGPFSLRLREHSCVMCRMSKDCTHYKPTTVPTSWNLISQEKQSIL